MFFSERSENLKELLQTSLVKGGGKTRPGAGLEKYLEN